MDLPARGHLWQKDANLALTAANLSRSWSECRDLPQTCALSVVQRSRVEFGEVSKFELRILESLKTQGQGQGLRLASTMCRPPPARSLYGDLQLVRIDRVS